jgi:hypothetical protein
MAVNPLVIKGAGVPGADNSYYSVEKALVLTGGGAKDLVPEIGWILAVAVANVSYLIRTVVTPTYVTLIPAATGYGMIWSDGTNIFASKSSGGAGTASYFVVAHKP